MVKMMKITGKGIPLTGLLLSLAICTCLFSTLAEALDPRQPVLHYISNKWDQDAGLKSLSVYHILQSTDHFIWVETNDGVYRFDGRQFTPAAQLYLPYSSYVPEMIFSILLEDREGVLWLEGIGGIVQYRDNRFTGFIPLEIFPWDDFSMALEDSWGNIWLGSITGNLLRLNKGKLIEYGKGKGIPGTGISCIIEDKHGSLWVAALQGGIFKLKDDAFIPVTIDGLGKDHRVTWLYEDRAGTMWIGTQKGLAAKTENRVTWYTTRDGLADNRISEIFQDSSNNIWVGTDKGVNRFSRDTSDTFVIDSLMADDIINVIAEDIEQNLWIGTEGSGIKQLRDRFFRTLTVKTDRQDYISGLVRTGSGETWAGTLHGDLVRIDKETVVEDYPLNDYISALVEDRNGNIWAATTTNGLYCLTPGPQRQLKAYKDEPFLENIYTLYNDAENILWIGTRGGLISFQEGKFTFHRKIGDISLTGIQYIYRDQGKDLWIGCDSGLYVLTKGRIDSQNIRRIVSECAVSFVYQDRENTLWIGTPGCGLGRYKNNEFIFYDEFSIRDTFAVNRIMEDENGYLWISSDTGICRVKRRDLDDLADNKIDELNFSIFGAADGLKTAECTGSAFNAAIEQTNGDFWFATKKGIAVFQPQKVKINKQAPRVFISQVDINGIPSKLESPDTIFEAVNAVRFHFTAPTFISQQRVFYKFKLQGYDTQWFALLPGDRRTVEYRNLSGGDYRFRVTACNSDGVWSKKGTQLPFEVGVAFYESALFIISSLGAAILLALATFFHNRRKQGGKKKKAQPVSIDRSSLDKHLVKLLHLLEEENIYRDDSVSLNSLAGQLGLHARQLSRLINEKLDKSFYQLINYYRIEEATRMLTDGNEHKTIIEIAFYVGYNSKSSFNQAFKKITGMTPSEFKKQSPS